MSDEKWKSRLAERGGNKKRFQYCADASRQEILYLRARQSHSGRNLIPENIFQYCTNSSGEIYFRALQRHSGRNPIDPSLQDNVFIPKDFIEEIITQDVQSINLHSIVNSRLIPGGQILINRQTVFFLLVDPMEKEHEDPYKLDLTKPRHAWCKWTGLVTQCEDIDIDFRVSGLPHAVVKQAENFRVRELVKKIESHPHRRALQTDVKQNNGYNPFSVESKVMIREQFQK